MEFKTPNEPQSTLTEACASPSGTQPYNDAQRSRERRRKAFKSGIIAYQNFSITIECLIRDMSTTGVKLQLEEGQLIPDSFNLTIPVDGCRVDCEIRWRSGKQIGAVFVGQIEHHARSARTQSLDANYIAPQKASILRKKAL